MAVRHEDSGRVVEGRGGIGVKWLWNERKNRRERSAAKQAKQVRCTLVHRWMKKEYDFRGGRRGAVIDVPAGKRRVTIRLDEDVLDWFRQKVDEAGGGNYQTLINRVLRDHISQRREQLEATLRRVIREELRRAG